MAFHWIGNVSNVTDADIKTIVGDMRAEGLDLAYPNAFAHLERIDPEGTLNIGAAQLVERAQELGL